MPDHKVLIIEDDPIVAASIRLALEKLGFEIEAVATDYLEAQDKLISTSPDIAFVDINLNGRFDGLRLAETIYNKHHFPYIFLTAYADRHILDEAKRLEPSGYIVKPFDENDLLANIEIALFKHAQRQNMLHPKINWETINSQLLDPLSKRELEVLTELLEGKTNNQMAEDLFVSLATVKSHLRRIYTKLDVGSRTAAIAKLRELSKQ